MPTAHTLLVFSLVAVVFVAIPGPRRLDRGSGVISLGLGGWAAASGSR